MSRVLNIPRIFLILCICGSISGCGNSYKIEYDEYNSKLHNREITFNVPMVYILTKGIENEIGHEISKYGRELDREKDLKFRLQASNKTIMSEPIQAKMQFIIKNSFHKVPVGLTSDFNSEIWYFVLQDENSILSVISFYSLKNSSDFRL